MLRTTKLSTVFILVSIVVVTSKPKYFYDGYCFRDNSEKNSYENFPWLLTEYKSLGIEPINANRTKCIRSAIKSCATVPINLPLNSIELHVYLRLVSNQSGLTVILFNENDIPIIVKKHNKLSELHTERWNKIQLDLNKSATKFVNLLGNIKKEEIILIDSLFYNVDAKSESCENGMSISVVNSEKEVIPQKQIPIYQLFKNLKELHSKAELFNKVLNKKLITKINAVNSQQNSYLDSNLNLNPNIRLDFNPYPDLDSNPIPKQEPPTDVNYSTLLNTVQDPDLDQNLDHEPNQRHDQNPESEVNLNLKLEPFSQSQTLPYSNPELALLLYSNRNKNPAIHLNSNLHPEYNSDPVPEPDIEPEPEINPDYDRNPESYPKNESDPDLVNDPGLDPNHELEPEPNPDLDPEPDSDTEKEPDSEPENETDPEHEPDPDLEPDSDSEPDPDPDLDLKRTTNIPPTTQNIPTSAPIKIEKNNNFWNPLTITLVAVGCFVIISVSTVGAYWCGRIRTRDENGYLVDEIKPQRIIPRVRRAPRDCKFYEV